jgi:predicted DCC family thiol-disulfide oxidoreductase YuxK
VPMTLPDRLFAPANARALGVMRLGVGAAALMELAGSFGRVLSLAEPSAVRVTILEPVAWVFANAAPLVLVAWLVAGVAFSIGLLTTAAGMVLAAVMFGLVTADGQFYSNHGYLIAFGIALLTAGGAGTAFSLDARRSGTDGEPVPAWTVLALRAQLTILYAFSALAKLNPSFLSGTVIAGHLRRGGIGFPEEWIGFESMFVLSILVVCAELFLAVGLWRARWRPAAFVVGLTLHVGIVFAMNEAWALATFSVATLSLYLAFVDAPRGGHVVVWDDACGFCGAWVRWFRRLDWLDALRFMPRSELAGSGLPVDEATALEAMHVVGPQRTSRAFGAVTDVASVLPLTFLLAPFFRIPLVARVGERMYARVALRRLCRITRGSPTQATDSVRP